MTTGFYFDASARVKDKPFGKIMRRLGQSFAQVHREYVSYCADNDGTANDFGWLYNERPHTGFLAAAAWRQKGWIAIEEHRTKKKGGNGRADLFIGARLGKQFYTLAIEAKLACCNNNTKIKKWLDPDDQDKKSGLAGAVGDAQRSINKTEVHYRCGVVFVCPIIRHLDSFNGISDEF